VDYVEEKNKEIIKGLVKNHFSLNEKSLKRFCKEYDNKFIDPIYEKLGLDENLRVYKKIDNCDFFRQFDKSYDLFKSDFEEALNIMFEDGFDDVYEYSAFIDNKITNKKKKSTNKLFKALKKVYRENFNLQWDLVHSHCRLLSPFASYSEEDKKRLVKDQFDRVFDREVEKIGEFKFPKGEMYAVLSMNFNDWFMNATAESWSSCLNMESAWEGAYWANVPGMIVDDNRAMFYITDKKRKKYHGIETDRFIIRSWASLTLNDTVVLNKSYPNKIFAKDLFSKAFNSRTEDFRDGWESKHSINFLTNVNGFSVFIYLDSSRLFLDSDSCEWKIAGGKMDNSYEIINSEGVLQESEGFYNYENGLSRLISSGMKIHEVSTDEIKCENCGCIIHRDDALSDPDECLLCEFCYGDLVTICHSCGSAIWETESSYADGEQYCNSCFEDNFLKCEECGDTIEIDASYCTPSGHSVCESCFDSKYSICVECSDPFEHSELNENNECEDCAVQTLREAT